MGCLDQETDCVTTSAEREKEELLLLPRQHSCYSRAAHRVVSDALDTPHKATILHARD